MDRITTLRRASAEHRLALRTSIGSYSAGTVVRLVRETQHGLLVSFNGHEFEVDERSLVVRRPRVRP